MITAAIIAIIITTMVTTTATAITVVDLSADVVIGGAVTSVVCITVLQLKKIMQNYSYSI